MGPALDVTIPADADDNDDGAPYVVAELVDDTTQIRGYVRRRCFLQWPLGHLRRPLRWWDGDGGELASARVRVRFAMRAANTFGLIDRAGNGRG